MSAPTLAPWTERDVLDLLQRRYSEAFRPYMDYWWLVVSDPAIVKDGELPDGWGLLAATANFSPLRLVKQAKRNARPEPIPKTMLATLLRAVAKTASRPRPLHRPGVGWDAPAGEALGER